MAMVKGQLELLLLGVLRRGPQHGYAVITELRDRSDGAFDLPEGTVYPALHKLEAAGLVASGWSTVEGRKRRVYELTADGHAALAEQRREWRRFARGMEAVMGT
jgi:DNA-binding PadR family transcriptional regulator